MSTGMLFLVECIVKFAIGFGVGFLLVSLLDR